MIREYVTGLANQAGIQLSGVKFVEGRTVGCLDVHLLHLVVDENMVSTLVHQSELDELQRGSYCTQLDMKIRAALSQLQLLMEPEQERLDTASDR